MILDLFSVEAVACINAELVEQCHTSAYRKGNTLVGRSEQYIGFNAVVVDALCIELTELCKLCAGLVVACVYEVRSFSATLECELAECKNSAVNHEFNKALFIRHTVLLLGSYSKT